MSEARDHGESSRPARAYHHGNLREALVACGIDLARAGGPDALVLREVTRRIGVTPRAAYRHFADRDALVTEIARVALSEMATLVGERMTSIRADDALEHACASLRTLGIGYIDYALDEPGLFAVAMYGLDRMVLAKPSEEGHAATSPYAVLEQIVSAFVAEGVLAAERMPAAVTMCWSSVHGFATLATQGPLREVRRARAREMAEEMVTLVVDGLAAGRRP
ncbi:TetR family transcriptional regulator [Pseudoclavibacter endophyticus]|uniref:TetR/AcrR family transcriptional regulator n=1 Tax=Pseudoclavibacter endophyticus TaxID=1778590 RepID=A0A6H9WGV9_9MICO|nr:TetR/AcrR family transcriptional regulator [Pseudoclavibacter endophyticus]KAB1648264.1 TetR/AcrR family transcriptional regulator [Pseudoclavibacter endophyticus]GGA71149.1 TetR family transcriptional regulator [Pseudoclavibacter endophyticus]